jgi:malonyl-CoA O-methyltransferase
MNSKIKKSFNQAASSYDANCQLQQYTGEKLIDLLIPYHFTTPKIVDLGCGTGIVTEKLASACQFQELHAVDFADHLLEKASARLSHTQIKIQHADFDQGPLHHNLFDIMFSNMALHWSAHFQKTLKMLTSQLNDNGIIAFTVPLMGTLKELQTHFSINQFLHQDFINQQLIQNDCEILTNQHETILLRFDDTLSALRSIKHVGANATTSHTFTHMRGKSFLKNINIGKLTYQIGYFIARKKGTACQLNYLLPVQTQTPAKHTSASEY